MSCLLSSLSAELLGLPTLLWSVLQLAGWGGVCGKRGHDGMEVAVELLFSKQD